MHNENIDYPPRTHFLGTFTGKNALGQVFPVMQEVTRIGSASMIPEISPAWRHTSLTLVGVFGLTLGLAIGPAIQTTLAQDQPVALPTGTPNPDATSVALPARTPAPSNPINAQPRLAKGDQGPLVIQLQVYLQKLGYLNAEPNGNYGDATEEAVRSLQKKRGLAVDGVMNQASWDVLMTDYQIAQAKLQDPNKKQVNLPPSKPTPQASVRLDASTSPNSAPNLTSQASPVSSAEPSPAPKPASLGDRLQQDQGFFLQVTGLSVLALGLLGSAAFQLLAHKKTKTPAEITPPVSNPSPPVQTLETVPPTPNPPRITTFSTEDATAITYPMKQEPSSELAPPESVRMPALDKVEELITHLGSHTMALRHRAIWELGQQADSRAIKPLLELLPLSDSRQQSLILAAMSEIGLKTFKPMKQVLAISLDSPNAEVRKNAIRDLERLYEAVLQSSQLLSYALNDPDPEVQETAQWALEQLDRLNHSRIPHRFKRDSNPPQNP